MSSDVSDFEPEECKAKDCDFHRAFPDRVREEFGVVLCGRHQDKIRSGRSVELEDGYDLATEADPTKVEA